MYIQKKNIRKHCQVPIYRTCSGVIGGQVKDALTGAGTPTPVLSTPPSTRIFYGVPGPLLPPPPCNRLVTQPLIPPPPCNRLVTHPLLPPPPCNRLVTHPLVPPPPCNRLVTHPYSLLHHAIGELLAITCSSTM